MHKDEDLNKFKTFDKNGNEILDLSEYTEYSIEKETIYEFLNSKEAEDTINFEHYKIAIDLVKKNKITKDNVISLVGFKEFYEADSDKPKDNKLSFDDFK